MSSDTNTGRNEESEESESTVDIDSVAQTVENAAKVLAAINGKNADAQPEEEDIRTPDQVMGSNRKKAPRKRPPPPPSVPAKVKKMLGDGERYRFYKVDTIGKQSLISDYTDQDLSVANYDIELFIQNFLIHKYGDGGYMIKIFSNKGLEVGQKSFSVLSPSGPSPAAIASSGGSVFEQGMVTQQTQRLQDLQDKLHAQEQEEKARLKEERDKFEKTLLEMQKGNDGGGSMMLLMMMKDQQRQAEADADRRAAEMRREQAELQLKLASLSAPQPQPLPPPPPPVDPLAQFATLLGLMKQMAPPPTVDPMAEYWRQRAADLEKNQQPALGIEDMFAKVSELDALVQGRYGPPPSDGKEMVRGFLDNFAENMHALKEVITAAPTQPAAQPAAQLGAAPAQESDPLPDGFLEIIIGLDDADDDLERINTIMSILELFANCGIPKYQSVARGVLQQLGENKPKPVMFILGKLLDECVERDMISEETKRKTRRAFDKHFDDIYRNVAGLPTKDEEDMLKAAAASKRENSAHTEPPSAHVAEPENAQDETPSEEPTMVHVAETTDAPALVQGGGA